HPRRRPRRRCRGSPAPRSLAHLLKKVTGRLWKLVRVTEVLCMHHDHACGRVETEVVNPGTPARFSLVAASPGFWNVFADGDPTSPLPAWGTFGHQDDHIPAAPRNSDRLVGDLLAFLKGVVHAAKPVDVPPHHPPFQNPGSKIA